jgi:hypothetical protein
MNSLTLDKALELYEILGAYIPEAEEDIDALDFIGKIIKNIRASGDHQDYVDAVMLMSDKKWEEIKILQSIDVFELFIKGLTINKIVSLKIFCDEIGFGYARSR